MSILSNYLFKDAKTITDLLNIMGYLFKEGADPTIKSNNNKSPRDIATEHGFRLGAELLGNSNIFWILNYYVLL